MSLLMDVFIHAVVQYECYLLGSSNHCAAPARRTERPYIPVIIPDAVEEDHDYDIVSVRHAGGTGACAPTGPVTPFRLRPPFACDRR